VKSDGPSQDIVLPVLDIRQSLELLCEVRGISSLLDIRIVQLKYPKSSGSGYLLMI
jgi:hypothetical protein